MGVDMHPTHTGVPSTSYWNAFVLAHTKTDGRSNWLDQRQFPRIPCKDRERTPQRRRNQGEQSDMSRLYGEEHRTLQDRFQSRPLADRIEQIGLKTEIGDDERAFIESRDFFSSRPSTSTASPQFPTRAAIRAS
jgi:hypothetical protein